MVAQYEAAEERPLIAVVKETVISNYRSIQFNAQRYDLSSPVHLEQWAERPALLDADMTRRVMIGRDAAGLSALMRDMTDWLREEGEKRLTPWFGVHPKTGRLLVTLQLYAGD